MPTPPDFHTRSLHPGTNKVRGHSLSEVSAEGGRWVSSVQAAIVTMAPEFIRMSATAVWS